MYSMTRPLSERIREARAAKRHKAAVKLQLPYAFRELRAAARYKAFHGGRGGAKSHSFAQELILRGREQPLRVLCCREIQKAISSSVKQLLDDKIEAAGLSSSQNGFYTSTDKKIYGGNGTMFLFAGLRTNPDAVKSTEGIDIAWVEEANTVSQRSWGLLTPTVRKPNSEIWASWNRRFATDPVDNMFLGGTPPPRSIIRKVGWQDNPWFPDVLMEEMLWDKKRDYDKWLHVWEGEPVIHSQARVFKNWVVEDIDHMLNHKDAVPRLGADWGFSVDPTVLVECYVIGRTLYFRREAYKVHCEIDETPALFAGNCDIDDPSNKRHWTNTHGHKGFQSVRAGNRIVADGARPETISYMANKGFNIIRARKGAGSVEEGVEFIKSYDVVIHPDCAHVIDEFTYYSYKEDPLTGEVLPILKDRDNHVIDAARYALEDLRRRPRSKICMVPPKLIKINNSA